MVELVEEGEEILPGAEAPGPCVKEAAVLAEGLALVFGVEGAFVGGMEEAAEQGEVFVDGSDLALRRGMADDLDSLPEARAGGADRVWVPG